MTDNAAVKVETEDGIALVALNNPPVNALGVVVRQGLVQAIADLNLDPQVKVIAIYGEGKAYSAGADIREFGKPPLQPFLPDVLNQIEASETPVISVIHGNALGGGLELALASHARIGLPGTTIGLPEVTLGILPGAGGTQRLPRLVPLEKAIDIISTGRHLSINEAVELGLIDRIGQGSPREVAVQSAKAVLDGSLPTRRTGDIEISPDLAVIKAAKAKLQRKRPALAAPIKAVEVMAAAGKPIAEGLRIEREGFMELMASPDRQGLIHAFAAERAVKQFPESDAAPRRIDSIGVIGGGTMGIGIATALLQAGYPVTLVELVAERAAAAQVTISGNLDGSVARKKMTPETRDKAAAALSISTTLESLASVDLVIEAVFEDMAVKTGIFSQLDKICKDGAILGTNTSYLDVNVIASATTRPQDVIGLHFFSPAHVMRLIEIVVADRTAAEVVAAASELAKRMKKVAVRSGVCDGFIGNRILAHYRKAADYMLLDGASFEQIDSALEAFGFAMGPFAVADLAGLDIAWANRKRKAASRPPEERYSSIADKICEKGWFGRKTGKGYYLYDDPKSRTVNPDVLEIIDAERQAAGITPQVFSDDEIVARYMTAMISEATRVVDEGIAQRPIDVDAVLLFGYGFPRHHGGPLNYADRIGAARLVEQIETYAKDDHHYWQVPGLLRDLALTGGRFDDLNKR